ncbi:outer membrane protein TolC [Pontibacter ummariensis]|uniref:Outer membrane protein TolC n=1 Tax=Pontibacter ummariensis TaxID=1610492 RepID=A0A239HCP8_9BACT|nr:TolC family protein [Pontibacter ummariensis]PRY10662.1 outer membrane protein TolC [Pontibacter ummariensis]SNS78798.1 Outer membrane protein TolC [Pontibacter ummariensis]
MRLKNSYIRLWFALVLLVIGVPLAKAQEQDSVQVLTLQEYHRLILQYHPVASQAALLTEQARQELRIARGAFDPTVSSKLYRKEYNGKEYYNLWSNTLRIPTWFGPELVAGFDKNSGLYLSTENVLPPEGLSYAGISVPLGQGLFIDERRATIRQAKLMQGIAEAERVKLINKLLLDATKDYWEWLQQYRTAQLYQEAMELTGVRLQAVKARVQEGDLAAIDTVEALVALQDRELLLQQALLALQNARLEVAVHLWAEDQVPLELQEGTIPALLGAEVNPVTEEELAELLAAARINHPDLLKLGLKGEQLEVERRYAANKLLPKLNAEYNVLQRDFYLHPEVMEQDYLQGNYKLGLSFSVPLFLRQERGKLQLTKAKLQANNMELVQQSREIEYAVLAAYNELQALEEQLELQQRLVANALALRQGEQIRFESGESSLFLINAREVKLLEAQAKLYALRAKYAKAKTTLFWAAGEIPVE